MKISQLPQDSSPAAADYLAGNQASGPTTQRFKLSDLATFMWTLANIPSGQTSPITRDSEMGLPFVASGLVWSGDSYAVNRNASMTAGVCYINGRRISISAVTARTFTASVDTYIDILDNGDGTGTLVYTTALNNAASPALASNSIRIGIVVTGATTIAAAASINQGQVDRILPIASSIAYTKTDSLGNLICPRDPQHQVLGMRFITSNFVLSASQTVPTQITGLSCPVIVPTGRDVKISIQAAGMYSASVSNVEVGIYDGVVNSGPRLIYQTAVSPTGSYDYPVHPFAMQTPSSTSKTYNGHIRNTLGANSTIEASATAPAILLVELK